MLVEQFQSAIASVRSGRIAAARPVAMIAAVAGAAWNVAGVIGTGLDRLLTAHERWRQRQALLALDDHLLKDIGVSRADVEREARKSPWEA